MLARRAFIAGSLGGLVEALVAEAQAPRVYQVGVVIQGGSAYYLAVDGLRDGLRELGLEDGKQLILHVRDAKGDLKAVEAAARGLEAERVDLIYSTVGRFSATQVQRVLLGANPGDLPVVQIERIPFVVNKKTAKALGLTIPPSVLARADEILE
jgi:ABC-type uncharacterized transport system substrate-binding protein